MQFYTKRFGGGEFKILPLGDWHLGSPQCDVKFIKKAVAMAQEDPKTWVILMGDLIENAIIGSKGDVYKQTEHPDDQIDRAIEILRPIKDKILFAIAGNHESRTTRQVGIVPEKIICQALGVPFKGYSCYANLLLPDTKTPYGFSIYCHHNYGGGYKNGSKVNTVENLRLIAPTADAVFSAHVHLTSRTPWKWYEVGRTGVIEKVGYNYLTGSALTWHESYAEEKGKRPSVTEFIVVTFKGSNNGRATDGRRQVYEVITA